MPKLKPNQFILDGHTFTERPVSFNTEMVQANMEGRKTQTRRTKGHEKRNENPELWTREGCRTASMYDFKDYPAKSNPTKLVEFKKTIPDEQEERKEYWAACPYGDPGDLLWVREKTRLGGGPTTHFYQYYADRTDWIPSPLNRWKQTIHMPKAAARLWLMVEDVRCERLQDISEEDAIAEGCSLYGPFGEYRGSLHPNGGTMRYRAYSRASDAFRCIWESINGSESLKANPWVWVIQYRILSKTGRPSEAVILDHYRQITQRAELTTSNP